jgi:SAM-dependent methyltransferase
MSQEQLEAFMQYCMKTDDLANDLQKKTLKEASKFAQELGFMVNTADIQLRLKETAFLQASIRDHCIRDSDLSVSLDLGSGARPRNPFGAAKVLGIDIVKQHNENVLQADLFNLPIPLDDESMDCVTAFDFLEHVPRVSCFQTTRFPFVELMNQIYRVLKRGGLFFSRTPIYPSKLAFQDPTHVNIMTEETMLCYFCTNSELEEAPWASRYGYNGKFQLVSQAVYEGWLMVIMQKPHHAQLI